MRKLVVALAIVAAGAVFVLPGAAVTATGGPQWSPVAGSAPSVTVVNPGTTVLSTAVNSINGFWNQGWWSDNVGNSNGNTNHIAGHLAGGSNHRDYFTFDITALKPNHFCPIRSATLNVERGQGSGAAVLNYQLNEVTTDPVTLSQKVNNPDAGIYADLGSGPLYGSYLLPTTGGPNFNLALNATALSALAAAKANGDTFFSLGGALVPQPVAGDVYLMGFTGSTAATLTVNWPILCRIRPPV